MPLEQHAFEEAVSVHVHSLYECAGVLYECAGVYIIQQAGCRQALSRSPCSAAQHVPEGSVRVKLCGRTTPMQHAVPYDGWSGDTVLVWSGFNPSW